MLSTSISDRPPDLRLRLDGQQMQLLGMDSGRFPAPETVEEMLLTPENRADLLVTTTTGDTVLRTFYQNRGRMPGMMGPGFAARNPAGQPSGAALATLRIAGDPVASPTSVPAQQSLGDLRSAAVAARRQIVLTAGMGMGGGMMRFTINGREFPLIQGRMTAAGG